MGAPPRARSGDPTPRASAALPPGLKQAYIGGKDRIASTIGRKEKCIPGSAAKDDYNLITDLLPLSGNDGSNFRDRVFGLIGFICRDERIAINYDMKQEEVFFASIDVIRRSCKSECKYISSRFLFLLACFRVTKMPFF